ncbi:dienelactone hydrolase family protein [Nonomuraea sp. NPDC049750]|uniref:dienelactone hydrolase family protein n=1 Tax=Nonomuraea sp. NPDC049750 TaxID=3154738 RepID=UPI0033E9EB3B
MWRECHAEEAAVGLTSVVPFLLASRLRELGAEHVPGPDFQPQVIRDGRLVTGQNPASAMGVAEAVVSALADVPSDTGTAPVNPTDITVRTSDGPMGGYLARPAGDGVHPAVIVAHQLFGLTEDVRAVADRIAGMGYVVLAPDYYHRADPGVELPATDEGRARGFELIATLSRTGVLYDTRAAADYLAARDDTSGAVGMVGLSLGGHLAYLAATQLGFPITVVLYAGWLTGTDIPVSGPEPTLDLTPGIKGKLVYIVGDRDHAIIEEQHAAIAERLQADGIRHEMVVLAGAPHAFLAQEDSPYHAETWQRIEQALADELA